MANVVETIVRTDDEVNLDPIKKKYDKFTSDLSSDMEAAGKKIGDKFTGGMAAGIEKANAKIVKANETQEKSIRRLQLAQQRLQEIEQSGTAKKSAKMAAEYAFADALKAVEDATRDVAVAEREREDIKRSMSGTTKQTVDFDMKAGLSRIKGQAISELKSAGIAGGAAFAGGIAAGLSPVAAAGFFVAIAAMAQSSNQVVRAKFADLWEGIKQGAQEASADTSDEFVRLAESLGRTFNSIKPQLEQGFRDGAPLVDAFADGVDRAAKTSMPGLLAATRAFATQGDSLASTMESAGRSVSNFFMESKEGAQAGGEAMEAFGRIVERMGSFAGRAVADLANMSEGVIPQFEGALDSAMDTAENFIETIGPGLAGGAQLALGGLGALLQLINGIITVLGPASGPLLSFATGLKALDMITFGGVRGQWDSFMGSIRQSEGPAAKAKAGLTGILTTLGPVGVAAGALTLGLGYLADKQAEAADKARKHREAIKTLATEFERTGGKVDQAIQKMVGDRLVNDFGEAKDAANDLGISLGTVTAAALKQGTSYDDLHNKLTKIIETERQLAAEQGTDQQGGEGSNPRIENAEKLLRALEALGEETNQAKRRQQELADAMTAASGKTNTLAEEFGTLADKTATAESKAQALYTILRRMAGGAPEVEEATKAWEEFVDTFSKDGMDFESKAAGTQKWADALVNAKSQINLTTEDGRKLFDTVKGMAQAFDDTAVSMQANGASADQVRGRLQVMRDQFIDAADKMGFTRQQAEALANQYGLIPDAVDTLVRSNLSPEIQKAIDLGAQIRGLPDGQFVVSSNVAGAQKTVDNFIHTNDGRVIHIQVKTSSTGVQTYYNKTGGGMPFQASGGPARGGTQAAQGGARTGIIWTNEGGHQETIRMPDRTEMAIPITAPMGSQINPSAGNRFLNGGGGEYGVPIIASIEIRDDGSAASKAIGMLVKEYVKFKGGDPVKALGQ